MRRYILLGEVLIMIGFAFYFHMAREHVFRSMLKEKAVAVANDVDYTCSMVDYLVEQDGGWEAAKYMDSLKFLTERIDATPNIYAELLDSQFTTLSNRIVPEDDKWYFEPREFPELMHRLKTENNGSCAVKCPERMCPYSKNPLEIYLHWKWIPTNKQSENRVLLVVGVTQHSVNTALENWMVYGIIILMGTFLVSVICSFIQATVEKRKRSFNYV